MKVKQLTAKGNTSKSQVEVQDEIWGAEMNEDLVVQTLNVYRDNQQKGTAHTQTRTDVSGGGRKPWAQKGTGRARHGSIRSPLWVGGGVTFGPRSHKRLKKIPKKMKARAMRSVFSQRLRDDEVVFLKDLPELKEPSTKAMNTMFEDLGLQDQKITMILSSEEQNFENIKLSIRNLAKIKLKRAKDINIFDIMDCKKIVISVDAVKNLEERLQ
jgi:large subunit ribosomal protein L4